MVETGATTSQILQTAGGLTEPERRILAVVADDARITNAGLAGALDMPPSTSLLRMQGLRDRGVVRGFHAHIDRRALGLSLEVFVSVDLVNQHPATIDSFLREAHGLDHVMGIMRTSGTNDFVLHVYVSSTDQLMERVIRPLSAMPELRRTDTSVVVDHWQRQSSVGAIVHV